LKRASIKGAKIDVRLFIGQVPKNWNEEKILKYFSRFGDILETKIIRGIIK
jgi:RNA recognition motif-containing protein